MSHEIDFTTGEAAIAYRGAAPWHGYGFHMPANAPIEEWLKAAQLEWVVNQRPVKTTNLDGAEIDLPNVRALMRSDSQQVLSVVSDKYNVVQPHEVLEFFRELADRHGFEIETAGALSGGRRVWALARTGQEFNLNGDVSRAYLLLVTSYDKSVSTTGQFTAIRVVCNNTLSLAVWQGLGQTSGIVRVPHSSVFDAKQVQIKLGLLEPVWKSYSESVAKLADVKISKKQAVEFFVELMGYEQGETESTLEFQMRSDKVRSVKQLLQSYEFGPGSQLDTSKDTAWGLVNAVTHYTDHTRQAKNAGSRLNSAWFGDSAALKYRAVEMAHRLAA